jgi:hypothetical protein
MILKCYTWYCYNRLWTESLWPTPLTVYKQCVTVGRPLLWSTCGCHTCAQFDDRWTSGRQANTSEKARATATRSTSTRLAECDARSLANLIAVVHETIIDLDLDVILLTEIWHHSCSSPMQAAESSDYWRHVRARSRHRLHCRNLQWSIKCIRVVLTSSPTVETHNYSRQFYWRELN